MFSTHATSVCFVRSELNALAHAAVILKVFSACSRDPLMFGFFSSVFLSQSQILSSYLLSQNTPRRCILLSKLHTGSVSESRLCANSEYVEPEIRETHN